MSTLPGIVHPPSSPAVRRGRSPGPSSPAPDTNDNGNGNGNSSVMSRWLPYVQIPKSLGSLLIPRSFSFSNSASSPTAARSASTQRSVLTPTSVLLASSSAHMDPTLLVQSAIKRITSSCRQLLLGVLDLSEVTDEHVSLLYTAVVREFFHTMSVLEANKIDISDLNSFPEDLRASLDDLFESSGGATAAVSRPASPELVRNPRLSIMSTSEAAQNDAASESVNSLIHHLIRSLQVKHRQFLARLETVKSSTTERSHHVDGESAATSAPASTLSNSSYSRLLPTSPLSPRSPTAPSSPSDLIHKLYLQLDSTVQREKLSPPTPVHSLTLSAIHALFIRRFHTSLPPLPPSASEFPFKVYMQDPATRTFTNSKIPPRTFSDKGKQHVAAISEMKHDLRLLKADVADAQTAFSTHSTHTHLHNAPNALALTADLDARTADLWDLIEQARLDMLHHASIPTLATLDYAASEMDALMRLAAEMAARVDVAAPAWKRVWERELARVVDEQQALARVEGVLEVSVKGMERVEKVLEQLKRVCKLAEERGGVEAAGSLLPVRPSRQVGDEVLDPEDHGDQWASTVQGVLEEIQCVPVDHERRMRAVERTEKVRQWAKENAGGEPETPLAKELVSKARSKSRDTRRREVAIEEVERERERRNREVLAALREVQRVLDHEQGEQQGALAKTAE
ncbi:actin interacting protein 3-domain-containing protein [Catenaria anguillulae PL171]|uniref:Actin interacting protein 3-domain-containing protein n=1 Tax=Catenaria anguillulae PL171 TaxID=765915 RepID=A0A1Y2I147_9FUNG|nr:actin interacting protein 3-domain-containing protein [Catenaria anguillulae PL171]